MIYVAYNPEAPETAERILCQMMHKWRRRIAAIEAGSNV